MLNYYWTDEENNISPVHRQLSESYMFFCWQQATENKAINKFDTEKLGTNVHTLI